MRSDPQDGRDNIAVEHLDDTAYSNNKGRGEGEEHNLIDISVQESYGNGRNSQK